jgi:hypothetical protein
MKKTLIAASLGLTLLAGTSSVFAHDYDHHRSNGDVVAATVIGAIAGAMLSQNTGNSYYQSYGYPAYYNTPTYYNTPAYYYQTPVVNGYYDHDWHHHDRDHYDRDHHEHHDWRR